MGNHDLTMAIASLPTFERSAIKRERDAQSPLQYTEITSKVLSEGQQMRHFRLADYHQNSIELTTELDAKINNLKVEDGSPCDDAFWLKVNDVIDECLAEDDNDTIVSTHTAVSSAVTEVASPDATQPKPDDNSSRQQQHI